MKNLYDPACVVEIRQRLAQLKSDSPRQWGKMNLGQALAHCCCGFELALGERLPARMFLGRIIGTFIKPMALGNDEPMRKNTPTMKDIIILDERDLSAERERLIKMMERFVAAGPVGCTKHPHSFFGRLTPDEWAILMYKHLDHHLRQFGA